MLDGYEAIARIAARSCGDGNGGAVGALVLVGRHLDRAAQPELSRTTSARQALIHELGHVLGAEHEHRVMSAMRESGPYGKVGRRSGAPTDSLGRHAETIWADDLNFALAFHGSTSEGRPDPAASPWTFSSSSGHRLHHANEELALCPGASVAVNHTLVNLGKLSASYAVRIVLSSNDYISTDDRTLLNYSVVNPSGAYANMVRSISVPNVAAGVYHVGVIVDPADLIEEDDEYNNATETGLRIRVRSGC